MTFWNMEYRELGVQDGDWRNLLMEYLEGGIFVEGRGIGECDIRKREKDKQYLEF